MHPSNDGSGRPLTDRGVGATLPKPRESAGGAPPRIADASVMAELQIARAIFRHFEGRGEKIEIWEALLLSRQRAFTGRPDDAAAVAAKEAHLRQEWESLRRQLSSTVLGFRERLGQTPGLPEPADRFEVALAFLLASARDRDWVERWLDQPNADPAKPAEKLSSIARITEPYLEILGPWSAPAAFEEAAFSVEARPGEAPPKSALRGNLRREPEAGEEFDLVKLAMGTCEAISQVGIECRVWEAMALAMSEREPTRAALEALVGHSGPPWPAAYHEDARLLFAKILRLRAKNARWVEALREYLGPPESPSRAWEVALGLLITAAEAKERARSWLENPSDSAEKARAELGKKVNLAQSLLEAL